DVTNYILMETGHPLHAFDLRDIDGGKIVVRRATAGEDFKTLDGTEHKLDPENLLIADRSKGIALAGIMGGENSEVKPDTKNVLLESAWFNPSSIRKSSRMLSISSESSYRFERGSDIEGLEYAQSRAALLMADIAGGEIAPGRAESYPGRRDKHKVTVRPSRVSAIVGRVIEPDRIISILESLDMNPQNGGDDLITITVPFYRFDIEREIDLIEEIARHTGYENIESRIPGVVVSDRPASPLSVTRSKMTSALLVAGLDESVRYSFMSEADCDNLLLGKDHRFRNMVAIDNPISTEATHLRTSLLPGMLGGISSNDLHKSFEIGLVFESTGGGNRRPEERWMAGGIVAGLLPPDLYTGRNGKYNFFDLKGIVESALTGIGYSRRFSFASADEPFYYPKRQANLR
ncbi:Phenylalanyl-tRNA synthetase beta chain, partial [hydrothermal vent metagenome]